MTEVLDRNDQSIARVSSKHGGVAVSLGYGAEEETILTNRQAFELMRAIAQALNLNVNNGEKPT